MPTAFGPILEEVENETGANLGFKSADDTSDDFEMADFIQTGVEKADSDNIVPYETPELESPSQSEPHQTNLMTNSIIKVYLKR